MRLLQRILCKLSFHKWNITEDDLGRSCDSCPKEQYWNSPDGVYGFWSDYPKDL